MKKSFDLVDLFKFIASVMIFSMHCNPFESFAPAQVGIQIFARWGVPFFFMASSFFLFRKEERTPEGRFIFSKETLRSFVHRIVALYTFWFIYNLPNIYVARLYGKDLHLLSTWLRFVTEAVFSSTFTGSWFLVSCVFSALLIFWFSKNGKTKTLVFLTLPLYLICSIPQNAYRFLPSVVAHGLYVLCFPLNIFGGMFYFALGKYLSENEETLKKKIGAKTSFVCALVFFAVYAVVYFLIHGLKHYSTGLVFYGGTFAVSLCLAPTAFFLFLFCLSVKTTIENHLVFRKMSTIIYCAQGNLFVIKRILHNKVGIESSILIYVILLVFMAAIVACVLKLQRKSRWSWTRYLS